MVMRLPSRVGMLSGRPYSSSSTANRSSCFSPCSANWMERPRKKMEAFTLDPSCRNSCACLSLNWKSCSSVLGPKRISLMTIFALLALLVQVLLVVQNLAHRRVCFGADFHQVQFLFLCHGQSLGEGINALLGDVLPYQAHLRGGNFTVNPKGVFVLLASLSLHGLLFETRGPRFKRRCDNFAPLKC